MLIFPLILFPFNGRKIQSLMESTFPRDTERKILFIKLLLLAILGFHLSTHIHDYFSQPDSGMLGQVAERILAGEWPHIDFDDPYTGLGGYLHALSFKLLGVKMSSIRYVHFFFSLLGLSAFIEICFLGSNIPVSLACCLLGYFFSYPVSFESMPSWYVLDFSLVSTALLLRYETTGHRALLFTAGFLIGSSCLFKITGVYLFAAALPWIFLFGQKCTDNPIEHHSGWMEKPAWRIILLIGPPIILLTTIFKVFTLKHFLYYILPIGLLLSTGIYKALRDRFSVKGGLSSAFLFSLGFSIPIFLYATVFAAHGGFSHLVNGILISPQKRFIFYYESLGSWAEVVGGIIPAALLIPSSARNRNLNMFLVLLVGAAAILLGMGCQSIESRLKVWKTLAYSIPWIALVITGSLFSGKISTQSTSKLFLVSSMAFFHSLIQYPTSTSSIYFMYVAPLFALTLVFLLEKSDWNRFSLDTAKFLAVILGYVLFAWWNLGGFWFANDRRETQPGLHLSERCDVSVSPGNFLRFADLKREVQKHLDGHSLWAWPDSPDVYFILGKKNLTRQLYDFVSSSSEYDRILQLIGTGEIRVVVINLRGNETELDLLKMDFVRNIRKELPMTTRIDGFLIFWRNV